MKFERGERYNHNRLYSLISHTHRHMMNRCYEPSIKEYKYYGARGVYVVEDWHTLDGFLKDVKQIPGWNESKFLTGDIQLDKDTRVFRSLVYSPDTTTWLDSTLNRQSQLTNQKLIKATHDSGHTEEFTNQTQFAKSNAITQGGVSKAIRRGTPYKGWTFEVLEHNLIGRGAPSVRDRKITQALRNGKVVRECKIPTHLSRELGLDPRRVLECLSEKHGREEYKGYRFRYVYRKSM